MTILKKLVLDLKQTKPRATVAQTVIFLQEDHARTAETILEIIACYAILMTFVVNEALLTVHLSRLFNHQVFNIVMNAELERSWMA